jgi:hypothetical protein
MPLHDRLYVAVACEASFDVTVNVAERRLASAGVQETVNKTSEPAGTVAGSPLTPNSLAFVPPRLWKFTDKGSVPMLMMRSVVETVVPINVEPTTSEPPAAGTESKPGPRPVQARL